jgi:hypothetical protein
MAAKHSLRHMEESSLLHTGKIPDSKSPGFWDPTTNPDQRRNKKGEARP